MLQINDGRECIQVLLEHAFISLVKAEPMSVTMRKGRELIFVHPLNQICSAPTRRTVFAICIKAVLLELVGLPALIYIALRIQCIK